MLNQAQSAKINNENITLLPNVINNSIFKYSDSNPRKEVNSNFNILVGAANLREKYKGFEFVINALKRSTSNVISIPLEQLLLKSPKLNIRLSIMVL